jgi:hypothetical protein
MTPVRSIKNQYRGINAHLHSLWQSEGGWNNFHNPHIAQLAGALKGRLRLMGYTATIENSVQIRRVDEYTRRPKSDITIYDLNPAHYPQMRTPSAQSMTGVVLPLPQVLEDNPISEKPYSAIAIFPQEYVRDATPVAWIELLSPANKRPGDDANSYIQKRGDLLESGIVFVEIDYLHETSPTLSRVPNYSRLLSVPAHPYRIIVLDPRPEVDEGRASFNEFDVDSPIPPVAIPLNGDDVLTFDFDAPYQKQFEEIFYGDDVDYTQLPPNFDRYSPDDQMRIATRMLAVLEAMRDSIDLETGPFPVKPGSSLEAALEQLNLLAGQS